MLYSSRRFVLKFFSNFGFGEIAYQVVISYLNYFKAFFVVGKTDYFCFTLFASISAAIITIDGLCDRKFFISLCPYFHLGSYNFKCL